MTELPNNFEPTKEDLLTEIRELHFEMSVMQERVIQQFEMISELSELVVDISDHVENTIEEIYKHSINQAKRREKRSQNKAK